MAVTVLVAVLITLTVVRTVVGHVGVQPVGGDRDPVRGCGTVTVAVTVLVAVLITLTVVRAVVGHVGVQPVGGDRHPVRGVAAGNSGGDGVGGGVDRASPWLRTVLAT